MQNLSYENKFHTVSIDSHVASLWNRGLGQGSKMGFWVLSLLHHLTSFSLQFSSNNLKDYGTSSQMMSLYKRPIPHHREYRGNGYKLSAQRFLGSLEFTRVSYDRSMTFKVTINQSYVMLVHQGNDSRNRCAESLPFSPMTSGVAN